MSQLFNELHLGTEKNPLEIKPTYSFWAPFVGSNCRRGKQLFNSEFRKADHKQDLTSAGATPDNCSIEKLMDLFCEGKVCHNVELFKIKISLKVEY